MKKITTSFLTGNARKLVLRVRSAQHRKIRAAAEFIGVTMSRFVQMSALRSADTALYERDEIQAWDQMAPIGREFGSPDFERLMHEDFVDRRGIFRETPLASTQAPRGHETEGPRPFDFSTLLEVYRGVIGDDLPANATPSELAVVIGEQTPATMARLDQALQAAGVDDWLKSREPVEIHAASEVEPLEDDFVMEFDEEIGQRGLAYLDRMVARGPMKGRE